MLLHFLLALTYLAHVSTTSATLVVEIRTETGGSVVELFQQLNHCHLRLYLESKSALIIKDNAQVSFIHLMDHISYKSVVSIAAARLNYANWLKIFPNRLDFGYRMTQRLRCFVHAYVQGENNADFPDRRFLEQESEKAIPDIVLLITQNNSKLADFRKHIAASSYQNELFYAISNFDGVLKICHLCRRENTILEKRNVNEFSFEIENYYQAADLNGRYIRTDLDSEKYREIKSCDKLLEYSLKMNPPSVELCVMETLGIKLNFTLLSGAGVNLIPFAVVIRRTRLSTHYLETEVRKEDRVVVELGFEFEDWGYLITYDRNNSTLVRLRISEDLFANPFDVYTCSTILICLLSFCGVMIVGNWKEFDELQDMIQVPMRLFGSLLEQSIDPLTSLKSLYRVYSELHLMNCIIWYYGIFIIINSYKGKMFSELTISEETDYPRTLEQLTDADLPVITFTGAWNSYLQHGRNSILGAYLEDTIGAKNSPEYYPKLLNLTEYKVDGLPAMKGFSSLLYFQDNEHLVTNGSLLWHQVSESPKSFAEVDLLMHVQMQKQILEIFVPSKWSSSAIPIQNPMTCMPWTVSENAFYPVFKRGIGQIYESGLYKRWDDYHHDSEGLQNFYGVQKGIERYSGEDLDFAINRSMWRNYYFYSKEYPGTIAASAPVIISIKDLETVYVLVTSLMAVAAIVVVSEILIFKVKNYKQGNMETWCCYCGYTPESSSQTRKLQITIMI